MHASNKLLLAEPQAASIMADQERAGDAPARPRTLQAENNLKLPPSQSSVSVRSDNDDSTGYVTASSSRLSHLDSEPLTALPRIHLDSMSSTPQNHSSPLSRSQSTESLTPSADSSNDTSQANLASLSSVTTFVPSTLSDAETSDDDAAQLDPEATSTDSETREFVPNYDFDLRDPPERTLHRFDDHDDPNQTIPEAMEGDILTISHSHATSIADSRPLSRSQSHHSSFPMSLSASWPSLSLPPSAVKLQRRRRNILLRLLKTWEGREQVLHLCHSLVLLLYSSLDHPVPQTYRGAIVRPVGTVLAFSFPRPIRLAVMQRIYTTAEGIDNFRRFILIARWVTSATEAAMEHWQQRQDTRRMKQRVEELEREMRLSGEEPREKRSDREEGGFRWLQPSSLAPFDADEKGEESFTDAPGSKLGKVTGRGDATGAVGADVAENASEKRDTPTRSASTSLLRPFTRLYNTLFRHTHLAFIAETLSTVGEACETAAVLAGGGLFWRAVGIQKLGLPFLSRRRRQGIERLGIVLSLCSVLLSLLVLRMERKVLRSELRSAHRRIIRANDKLGWASELAGTTIDRDLALSGRKRDPSRTRTRTQSGEASVDLMGPDLQAAARDLDDTSPTLSRSSSTLSETWTVLPDDDEPRRRGAHKSLDVDTLLKSTERSLVRAESDLRTARRRLKINFWDKVANWSESIFLAYEAAMPHVDKDGVEGWTGLLASGIRLSSLWKEISWG